MTHTHRTPCWYVALAKATGAVRCRRGEVVPSATPVLQTRTLWLSLSAETRVPCVWDFVGGLYAARQSAITFFKILTDECRRSEVCKWRLSWIETLQTMRKVWGHLISQLEIRESRREHGRAFGYSDESRSETPRSPCRMGLVAPAQKCRGRGEGVPGGRPRGAAKGAGQAGATGPVSREVIAVGHQSCLLQNGLSQHVTSLAD